MNRRDRELLDRQMGRFQLSPHPVGLMMIILAGAFLVGIIAGSIIFTNQQPVQTASTDGKTALAISFLRAPEPNLGKREAKVETALSKNSFGRL